MRHPWRAEPGLPAARKQEAVRVPPLGLRLLSQQQPKTVGRQKLG